MGRNPAGRGTMKLKNPCRRKGNNEWGETYRWKGKNESGKPPQRKGNNHWGNGLGDRDLALEDCVCDGGRNVWGS